ncbi:MAG: TlpA family protein disulfide reductase [Thermomicrobiales bacterium]|nr:TlpA family protein disulfide reductase [Thermomicrobiales bacterium]MCO5221076.1 TlpA family protein disulfide reductase [Thermomicrobiales bacterium]
MIDPPPSDPNRSEHEPDEDPFEHGRVGYGNYAKYTPALLALGIILVIAFIGYRQWKPEAELPRAGVLIDQPAPAWNLTLLDGTTIDSTDLAGNAVVLNFWASWCAPCEEEMPELDALNAELRTDGVPATIIGVGVKRDNNDNALAMVDRLGVTYPIGRDTAGESDTIGPVTQAFGVDTFPATVFIRPDGTVSAIVFGPLSSESARDAIEAALDGD